MARDIEFRHNANTALAGICDDFASLLLRVEEAVGAHSGQLGEDLALDAEALIVGQVPVEDVELYGGHSVERALDDRRRA